MARRGSPLVSPSSPGSRNNTWHGKLHYRQVGPPDEGTRAPSHRFARSAAAAGGTAPSPVSGLRENCACSMTHSLLSAKFPLRGELMRRQGERSDAAKSRRAAGIDGFPPGRGDGRALPVLGCSSAGPAHNNLPPGLHCVSPGGCPADGRVQLAPLLEHSPRSRATGRTASADGTVTSQPARPQLCDSFHRNFSVLPQQSHAPGRSEASCSRLGLHSDQRHEQPYR